MKGYSRKSVKKTTKEIEKEIESLRKESMKLEIKRREVQLSILKLKVELD